MYWFTFTCTHVHACSLKEREPKSNPSKIIERLGAIGGRKIHHISNPRNNNKFHKKKKRISRQSSQKRFMILSISQEIESLLQVFLSICQFYRLMKILLSFFKFIFGYLFIILSILSICLLKINLLQSCLFFFLIHILVSSTIE